MIRIKTLNTMFEASAKEAKEMCSKTNSEHILELTGNRSFSTGMDDCIFEA